jgi:hypothetical protein
VIARRPLRSANPAIQHARARSPELMPCIRSTAADVAGPFAAVSKNLCNYPLARDRRMSKWRWWRGSRTGRWFGQYPGDDRIRCEFAGGIDPVLRRCPSAFDVNVLFLLLATAQHRNNDRVVFESRSAMLRALRYGCDPRNLDRLAQALIFWNEASIRFGRWYHPRKHGRGLSDDGRAKRNGGYNAAKLLPPPLKSLSFAERGRVELQLDHAWLELHRGGFFEKVPLPLPRESAAQNRVLCLLASLAADHESDEITYPRGVRKLCRKLGLDHSRRNRVLVHALRSAAAWFKQHGGDLDHVTKNGRIVFIMKRPKRRKRLDELPDEPPIARRPLLRHDEGREAVEAAHRQRLALYQAARKDPSIVLDLQWRLAAAKLRMPLPELSADEHYA